jgi:hypothetical protein
VGTSELPKQFLVPLLLASSESRETALLTCHHAPPASAQLGKSSSWINTNEMKKSQVGESKTDRKIVTEEEKSKNFVSMMIQGKFVEGDSHLVGITATLGEILSLFIERERERKGNNGVKCVTQRPPYS